MNQNLADPHVDFDQLVEYWLDETDDASTQSIDMHLLRCDACGAALDELIALAQGVRQAFSGGLVDSFITGEFVDRLQKRGLRVREYRVAVNGRVNCSVAPEDDVLVGRMVAPLEGVSQIDVAVRISLGGDEAWVLDVPFDASCGEVLFAPKLAELRKLPSHDLQIRLLARDDQGSRELGHYTFHHGG